MRHILTLALIFCLTPTLAAEPPREFRLRDVTVSMEEQPRWPVGYALGILIHDGEVVVRRTPLPCNPCKESEERLQISDDELLKLLNEFMKSGFFDARSEYSSVTSFDRGADGLVRLVQTVTTDEDRVLIELKIGEWRMQVLDEGEAPRAIRELQETILRVAGLRRQSAAGN